jgi:DNA repair exonuclease SbcCD ATPase subunit
MLTRIAEVEEQLREAEARSVPLVERVEAAEARADELARRVEADDEEREEATRLDEIREQHQQATRRIIDDLTSEKADAVRDLAEARADIVAMLQTEGENRTALTSLRTALAAANDEIARLEGELGDKDAERDAALAEAEQAHQDAIAQMKESRQVLLEEGRAAREEELAELRSAHQQELKKQGATHQETLKKLGAAHDEHLKKLGATHDENLKKQDELLKRQEEKAQQAISELVSHLATETSARAEAIGRAERAEATVTTLSAALARVAERVAVMESDEAEATKQRLSSLSAIREAAGAEVRSGTDAGSGEARPAVAGTSSADVKARRRGR